MARNLELKVKCGQEKLEQIQARAIELGIGTFAELAQIDTYYPVKNGRLKLREIETRNGEQAAELIAYRRSDEAGSRWSDYHLTPLAIERAVSIKAALTISCGVSVVVRKRRAVGIWRNTRIHLDVVENLGCFVELETVVRPGDLDEHVREEHEQAILELGLEGLPVMSGSYSNLVGAGTGPLPSIDQAKGFTR